MINIYDSIKSQLHGGWDDKQNSTGPTNRILSIAWGETIIFGSLSV